MELYVCIDTIIVEYVPMTCISYNKYNTLKKALLCVFVSKPMVFSDFVFSAVPKVARNSVQELFARSRITLKCIKQIFGTQIS